MKRIKLWLFLHIIYPLFGEYIDVMLNELRYAQVKNVWIDKNQTYVLINKCYPEKALIQFYKPLPLCTEIDDELIQVEKVIASGFVQKSDLHSSLVLLYRQDFPVKIGCLAKDANAQNYALYSLKELK